jgi:hypothetical protein
MNGSAVAPPCDKTIVDTLVYRARLMPSWIFLAIRLWLVYMKAKKRLAHIRIPGGEMSGT